MPDENKLAKLREIGMRLVETCATCEHGKQIPHEHDGEMLRRWGSCSKHTYAHDKHSAQLNVPAHSLMACNDYKRRDSYALRLAGGLAGHVPIVGTSELRRVVCSNCTWEGWASDSVLHELNAGGTTSYSRCCPKCEAVVE